LERLLFAVLLLSNLHFGFQDAAVQQTASGNEQKPAPLGKLVDVGGYRVHLYCVGSGSPTVVILGAGYSFDWGLVQPKVAGITQVCAYDHSGSAWSDEGPTDSCTGRVQEVHTALKKAGIAGPYVLVGHSLGGVVARLYASQYPDEVAGIVFVDHAFSMINRGPAPKGAATTAPPPPPAPVSTTPLPPKRIAFGMEDDPNFNNLPARDRDLHRWAEQSQRDAPKLNGIDMLLDCLSKADEATKDRTYPLGDRPLVDVTAGNSPPGPPALLTTWSQKYEELQTKLVSLSTNSKRIVARESGHFIIIDRPDVVVEAIQQTVSAVRTQSKL
jgi:pimeloyl-ACP methyl ester carboxylesterase